MHSDLKRGKAYISEWARIQEACIAVADADSENERAYRAAQVRHRKTLIDLGWRPPKPKKVKMRVWTSVQLPFPWMPREEWRR